jgi:hypothetical protein
MEIVVSTNELSFSKIENHQRSAYDRTTMKRCRKVMDAAKNKQADGESALIDIHSGKLLPQHTLLLAGCCLLRGKFSVKNP